MGAIRVIAAGVLFAGAVPANAAPAVFAGEDGLSSDTGHVLIEWTSDEPVTLDIARQADFSDARLLYRGRNQSYFLSGLADGDYILRLRAADGETRVQALSVAHQSLARALWLTLIGGLIGIAIHALVSLA